MLAGMVYGYLAQSFSPLDDALYGLYSQGLAADYYAEKHTEKA